MSVATIILLVIIVALAAFILFKAGKV